VNREMSSVPQDWADSGGCPAGGFTPDGGSVYAANEQNASVSVISTSTGKITATIPTGEAPYAAPSATRRPPPGWPGHEQNKPPAFAWAN
jgi:YVTN family beta-propeller protein